MQDHSNTKRGFHHLKAAWYGEANLKNSDRVDEIMIGYIAMKAGQVESSLFVGLNLVERLRLVLKFLMMLGVPCGNLLIFYSSYKNSMEQTRRPNRFVSY